MKQPNEPFLSSLMANPLLRFLTAGFLGLIIAILLLLLMRFLIMGFGDSGSGIFTRLFSLETVVLPGESQQRVRPRRPEYIEQLPEAPVFSDAEIKQEAAEFLSTQPIIEEPALPEPSALEELREKREEMISILENE